MLEAAKAWVIQPTNWEWLCFAQQPVFACLHVCTLYHAHKLTRKFPLSTPTLLWLVLSACPSYPWHSLVVLWDTQNEAYIWVCHSSACSFPFLQTIGELCVSTGWRGWGQERGCPVWVHKMWLDGQKIFLFLLKAGSATSIYTSCILDRSVFWEYQAGCWCRAASCCLGLGDWNPRPWEKESPWQALWQALLWDSCL